MKWPSLRNGLAYAGIPALLVGVLCSLDWFLVAPLGVWEGQVTWLAGLPTFLGGALAYLLPRRVEKKRTSAINILVAGAGTLLCWWLYQQKTSEPPNLDNEKSYNLLCGVYFLGICACFGYLVVRSITV